MYAIIKSGGRQARVAEGDVLEIDRVTSDGDLEFTPIMLVGDDGTVITDPSKLGKAKVKAKVLGETKGEKLHVFKFKNKTGYRRRIGHRQKFSTIEVTGITGAPKAKSSADADAKKASAKQADKKADKEADAAKVDAKQAASKKTEPKKAEPKKTESKKAESKKAESKKAEPKKTESKKAEPAEAAGAEAEDTKKEQEDS